MTKYKVVVSDQVFPSVELERRLLAGIDAELVVASGGVDEVLVLAADADAILNTYLPWSAGSIARLEKCRIIARYGIGFDNVDLAAARDAGIVVTNVPDYSVEEVATHALALILARRTGLGGYWLAHDLADAPEAALVSDREFAAALRQRLELLEG